MFTYVISGWQSTTCPSSPDAVYCVPRWNALPWVSMSSDLWSLFAWCLSSMPEQFDCYHHVITILNYQMALSQAPVAWCCDDLRLHGSGKTTHQMSETNKHQLVLNQMSQDPAGCRGPVLSQGRPSPFTLECVWLSLYLFDSWPFFVTHHVLRQCIIDEMCLHHPEGFALHEPSAKKVKKHGVLTSLGPHHKWSADGHDIDKLTQIGFHCWHWVLFLPETKIRIRVLRLRIHVSMRNM